MMKPCRFFKKRQKKVTSQQKIRTQVKARRKRIANQKRLVFKSEAADLGL